MYTSHGYHTKENVQVPTVENVNAIITAAKASAIRYMAESVTAYAKIVGSTEHYFAQISAAGQMDSPAGPFPADNGISHWVHEAARAEGVTIPASHLLTLMRLCVPTWREVQDSML